MTVGFLDLMRRTRHAARVNRVPVAVIIVLWRGLLAIALGHLASVGVVMGNTGRGSNDAVNRGRQKRLGGTAALI